MSVIKVHPSAHPFKDMACCVPIPNCIKHNVRSFRRAVLLIRNPYDSIWSEYQRSLFLDHVGVVSRTSFNRKHWEQAAMNLARDYAIMGKTHYAELEKRFSANDYIYVRYEDLLHQTRRYDELRKIAIFLNYTTTTTTISDERLQCAFILADKVAIMI